MENNRGLPSREKRRGAGLGDGRGVARREAARPAPGLSPGLSTGRGRAGCASTSSAREAAGMRQDPKGSQESAEEPEGKPVRGRLFATGGARRSRAGRGKQSPGRHAARSAVRSAAGDARGVVRRGVPYGVRFAGWDSRGVARGAMRCDARWSAECSVRLAATWGKAATWFGRRHGGGGGGFLRDAPGRFRRAAAFLGAEPHSQSTGLCYQRRLSTQLRRLGSGSLVGRW